MEQRVNKPWLAKAQQTTWLEWVARWLPRMLECGRHQDADTGVSIRPGKHHGANSAAGPQRALHAAQALQWGGEEHETQPAYHRVECGGFHGQRLSVCHKGLNVVESSLPGVHLSQRQNGRRQVCLSLIHI